MLRICLVLNSNWSMSGWRKKNDQNSCMTQSLLLSPFLPVFLDWLWYTSFSHSRGVTVSYKFLEEVENSVYYRKECFRQESVDETNVLEFVQVFNHFCQVENSHVIIRDVTNAVCWQSLDNSRIAHGISSIGFLEMEIVVPISFARFSSFRRMWPRGAHFNRGSFSLILFSIFF